MKHIVQCQKLSHYYGSSVALDHISFELTAGDPVGLVGPNGAGKTTLLRILCGFLRPTTGHVKLFDHAPGSADLIGKISALPQDSKLDPGFSISEQLVFYARLQGFQSSQAKHEVARVMDAVELQHVLNEKPQSLSHGMSKRVLIAQSLIGQPQLTLLDEPTAGLDPVNIRTIRSVISEQSSLTTFLISSHNLEELGRLCHQILLLDKGVIKSAQTSQTNELSSQFITLQMEPCPANELMRKLRMINGVIHISNPQKNEFIIEYNPQTQHSIDQQVMSCLTDHQWEYKQLIKGKSLEEKLFFESNDSNRP